MDFNETTPLKMKESKLNSDAAIHQMIERISHWLPTQGPIKDFIHHNTLHAFQSRPFHEGVSVAARVYGAHDYLKLSEFQRLYHEKKISDSALQKSLSRAGIAPEKQTEWKALLLDSGREEAPPRGIAVSGIRRTWQAALGVDLDATLHPTLFRLLGSFLDQGISIWRMPHASRLSFWECLRSLVEESLFPIIPLNQPECRKLLLTHSPEEVIKTCLTHLVGREALHEPYCLEMLLAHKGWSGMILMVEQNPQSLLSPRKIRVAELIALDLLMELGIVLRRSADKILRVDEVVNFTPVLPENMKEEVTLSEKLSRIWQEALEWTLYQDVLSSLEAFHSVERKQTTSPFAQAYFCIDDRFSSVRRYLEEADPQLETFATAGFFGLDFLFQGADSVHAIQNCPVVLKPKHIVREVKAREAKRPVLSSLVQAGSSHNTLFRGWMMTQLMGVWAPLKLALNVFRPGFRLEMPLALTRVKSPTKLQLLRESDEKNADGLYLGYSIPEMVDRVYGVFRSTGLTENFAELIVMIAHGSSSANNPHFAAYDCGACSGRPGAPNARAFAWMANHPEVRQGLRARGMHIPLETYVLGALFDTSRDEISYFDLLSLPPSHQQAFKRLNKAMNDSLQKNAKERCRRFELVSKKIKPANAHIHVKERSQSLFEPRPELNHATNALCVVGRRTLTKGLFFDRRAFLNSYDPSTDPKGDLLAGILGAVIPVCGGINLEYYFSRVDSAVYGAGTKLPHNVVSLVGVANGVDGDLQTGLPTQMTEIHDPVRLLTVVEQEPDIALAAVRKNPQIFEWVENAWVFYACFSPSSKKIFIWEKSEWVPLSHSRALNDIPRKDTSLEIIQNQRENIPVHRVGNK